MRKALALQATLLRFGWRSTLGQVLSSEKALGTKILRLVFFIYFPLWMLWTHFSLFKKLSNPKHVAELLQEWQLPLCNAENCQALLEPSPIWPEFLQLFWLGFAVALLAVLFGSIFAAASLISHESTDRDLDWIRTFPVRMRSFLWGKLLQTTVFNTYIWMIILPFLFAFFLARAANIGWTLPGILILALATACMTTSMGMTLDLFIVSRFGKQRRRYFRSLMVVLATAPLTFYIILISESPGYWTFLMKHGAPLQDVWLMRQLQTLFEANASPVLPLLLYLVLSLAVVSLNIFLMEKILLQGFAPDLEKQKAAPKICNAALDVLPPMMRRGLLLLGRDHGHLAHLLVAPLCMMMGMLLGRFSGSEPLRPAGLLFVLTMFPVMTIGSSAIHLVTREKFALWFYGSTPRLFTDIFKEQQRIVWILVTLAFLMTSAFLLPAEAFQDPGFALRFGLVLIFLKLYEIQNRNLALASYHPDAGPKTVRLGHTSTLMFIGPIVVFGIVFGNIWFLATQFILYIGMVLGYRQKALSCEVGFDDPMTKHKVPLGLGDGLILALVYAAILNASRGLAYLVHLEIPAEMPWYALIVSTLFFILLKFHFRGRQATDLPVYAGRISAVDTVVFMIGTAVAAAGTWLWMQTTFGWQAFELIYYRLEQSARPALALMLAASWSTVLIEEFIFRGLIQRGLEKRYGFFAAWILAAVLSTLCHKPQDFGPVLLVSLASGFLYHRSKILWPSLLLGASVHAIRWIWF